MISIVLLFACRRALRRPDRSHTAEAGRLILRHSSRPHRIHTVGLSLHLSLHLNLRTLLARALRTLLA